MIGERLGPYRIERELGAGGMGRVFAARDADGAHVALKVLHPHMLETPDAVERFGREIEIGRTVSHPNVVRTLGGGEADGHHFLAMEYVEGQTLNGLLADLQRVPEELCRHIGREMSKGLAAVHAAGAIHRDIKPENVLITPDHVVKIMDLGVARSTDDALRLSATGMFVGSLCYAAPEQLTSGGKDLDGRVDLHALGLVLYELATARSPFDAEDVPQVVHQVLHETPQRIGEIDPQFSAYFEEVVQCLIEKDRDARFSSAEELLAVLEAGESSEWWRDRARALQLATRRPIRRLRIPRETAVYGRQRELANLRAQFDLSRAGDGRVLLLEGEAGIGKSRLIDELMRQLEQDGEDVNFLFGSYPPGGAATADGAFRTAYREQFGSEGSAEYLTETPLLAPVFDALLRGDAPPEGSQPLSADALKTVLVHATRALSRERPTVVVIDDLHFAPEAGRALFASLAMAVPGHPVLLVGSARPGLPKDWCAELERLDHVARETVERLDGADVSRLLAPVIGSSLEAGRLAASIAATADGNPFFLFEIVRSLRESGVLSKDDDGSWKTATRITEIVIPASVRSLLDARIDRLSHDERGLLECAACWGFSFDGRLVAEALGMRTLPALRLLGRLEQEHGLVRAAGARFVFDHHAIQEHVHAHVHEELRREFHAALAETLEVRTGAAESDPDSVDGGVAVDLCDHSLRGGAGERALRYLRVAALHLERGYRGAAAVDLVDRALAVPGLLTGERRASVLLLSLDGLKFVAQSKRREAAAREALLLAEAAQGEHLIQQAAMGLAEALASLRRWDDAEAMFRRVIDIAQVRGDKLAEAAACDGLGIAIWNLGRVEDAHEYVERDLALSRETGDAASQIRAVMGVAHIRFSERNWDELESLLSEALTLARRSHEWRSEVTVWSWRGRLEWMHGRAQAGQDDIERSLQLVCQRGDRWLETRVTLLLGESSRERFGRPHEARERLERALALAIELGDREVEAASLHQLARLLRDDDQPDPAEERLLASLELAQERGDRRRTAAIRLELGSLSAARGDTEGARAQLEAARELSDDIGSPGVQTLARCELALLPDGTPTDALASFDEQAPRLSQDDRLEAQYLLWCATGDPARLEDARSILDSVCANAPEADRDALRTNLRVHRAVSSA